MKDEDVLFHYRQMEELYGELPDPDHCPIEFAYLVKLYRTYHAKENLHRTT